MKNLLDFKNRDLLYKDLLRYVNLSIVDEKYYKEYFGDFYITLSNDVLLIRYVNERSYLTITVASQFEPSNWSDLSFLIALISGAETAPAYNHLSNEERIAEFNQYLIENFEIIKRLFDKTNYQNTVTQLYNIKKDSFFRHFPPRP